MENNISPKMPPEQNPLDELWPESPASATILNEYVERQINTRDKQREKDIDQLRNDTATFESRISRWKTPIILGFAILGLVLVIGFGALGFLIVGSNNRTELEKLEQKVAAMSAEFQTEIGSVRNELKQEQDERVRLQVTVAALVAQFQTGIGSVRNELKQEQDERVRLQVTVAALVAQPTIVARTPEPRPTSLTQGLMLTTKSGLNVRTLPDAKSAQVGEALKLGEQIVVIARAVTSDGTWLQITQPRQGWVKADFVNLTGEVANLPILNVFTTPTMATPTLTPSPTPTPTPAPTVRSLPYPSVNVIATMTIDGIRQKRDSNALPIPNTSITKSMRVTVKGRDPSNNWLLVDFPMDGWILMSNVEITPPEKNSLYQCTTVNEDIKTVDCKPPSRGSGNEGPG